MYTYTVNVQCLVLNSPYTCKFPKAYGDTMTDISTTGTKDHNVTQSYHTLYVVGYEEKDHSRKMQFLLFFNLSPFQGHKSPRLPTWSVDSLGLLLHISNVRS